MKNPAWIALLLVLLPGAIPQAIASENVTVDLGCVLETMKCTPSFIISISEEEDGTLSGFLERPDQAPGIKYLMDRISVVENHLYFYIRALGASFEGVWVEAEGHWAGTLKQGQEFPLILKRGQPDEKPTSVVLNGSIVNMEGAQ